MRLFWLFCLVLIVVFHFFVIFAVVASLFAIPFVIDWSLWPLAIPVMIDIVRLLTTRIECPITNLENVIRKKLGMKKIGGFIGNYVLRPMRKMRKS